MRADDPDDWWHSLPLERRAAIRGWLDRDTPGTHVETPGQHALFHADTPPQLEQ